jgi:agarase
VALKTKFVASKLRHDMFTWLPEYDEPLAKHYGYRRSVHQGALKHGETYSFYQANLERKFGDNYIATWQDVTVKRMMNWGFTSFGNWIDPMFYHDNRVPFFANGWIIGDFKTVTSGNDLWSPLPDPFDPIFAQRARATVEQIADEVKNNPWCVGVFIDNEKSWGSKGSDQSRYAIVINTLKRADDDSPTKAHFTQLMKRKYQDIQALNTSWNTDINSWQQFESGIDLSEFTKAQINDYAVMLTAYANEYFSIVKTELKRVLPNHMYMGVRFASWGMTPEIIDAASAHVDVMSYNVYKEGLHANYWKFLEEVDMPSVIGEFHMGAMDSGLINPGLVHAQTQQDRANQYINYMGTVVDNPYFVGAHWFQYIDSPLTGRAYDGENYNVGFVSVTDTPYQPMIKAVKQVNSELYPRRFKQVFETNVKDH